MNPLKSISSSPTCALRAAGLLALVGLGAPALSAADPVAGISLDINLQGPPPPRHEVVVERERPGPDYIWVAGYWDGRPGRYTWVSGHWERPPHPGMRWMAPRWDKDRDGHYRQVRGGWQDGRDRDADRDRDRDRDR